MSKNIVRLKWVGHKEINLTDHAVVRALQRSENKICFKELQDLSVYDVRYSNKVPFDQPIYLPELKLIGHREGQKVITFIHYDGEMKLKDGKYEPVEDQ